MHRIGEGDEIYGFKYVIALAAAVGMVWILLKMSKRKDIRLPPGPPALPVIGNLHMLGKLPQLDLQKLAHKYGPVMYIRLGSFPTVVVSTAEMAKEFLKTHDAIFANRPDLSFGKNVVYDSSSVAVSKYGPYWKQIRRVVSSHLLGPRTLASFNSVRLEEMACMVDGLVEHCRVDPSRPVEFSKVVAAAIIHMTCRMTFGRKYPAQYVEKFSEMTQEFFFLAGVFDLGDFIPWLKPFDVQGLKCRQRNLHKTFDDFLETVLEEHLQSRATGQVSFQKDFVDILLDLMQDKDEGGRFTRTEIKATMLELLAAAADTSSVTLQWAMSELLKNPSIMKKVQEELDNVVGMDRKLVEESDIRNLEYLHAVVKETLRVHIPVPLLLPHESIEDCTISGYHIPANTRVVVNVWAIAKDPRSWGKDADIFRPERFIGSAMDVKGQHYELLPFGTGRRMCPGQAVAVDEILLVLGNLLHCFDWKLPHGMTEADLDMAEGYEQIARKAENLQAVPSPRLHKAVLETKI